LLVRELGNRRHASLIVHVWTDQNDSAEDLVRVDDRTKPPRHERDP
jgi:hypothetical protein